MIMTLILVMRHIFQLINSDYEIGNDADDAIFHDNVDKNVEWLEGHNQRQENMNRRIDPLNGNDTVAEADNIEVLIQNLILRALMNLMMKILPGGLYIFFNPKDIENLKLKLKMLFMSLKLFHDSCV